MSGKVKKSRKAKKLRHDPLDKQMIEHAEGGSLAPPKPMTKKERQQIREGGGKKAKKAKAGANDSDDEGEMVCVLFSPAVVSHSMRPRSRFCARKCSFA
jgi:hypothetical protein